MSKQKGHYFALLVLFVFDFSSADTVSTTLAPVTVNSYINTLDFPLANNCNTTDWTIARNSPMSTSVLNNYNSSNPSVDIYA